MGKIIRLWSPVILAFATLALAACNTVEGAGRDLSATGRAVSGAADRTSR